MTTLDEFAEITSRVIANSGFEEFFPTVLVPSRKDIRALEGAPEDVNIEHAALGWAARVAASAPEYLVAFKVDPGHFKIVRVLEGSTEQRVYSVRAQQSVQADADSPRGLT